MSDMNDIAQRIRELMAYKGLNISDTAKSVGITQPNLSSILAGKRPIGDNVLNKFVLAFNANKKWLLSGEGEMFLRLFEKAYIKANPENGHNDIYALKASNNQQSDEPVTKTANTPYPVKPFINSVYAVCGTPSGFSIAIKENECEGLSLPFMNEYDFSIKAKGDSMINRNNPARSIREGDIVVCRLWKSRSHVRWGEVYALATSEGVVIKKLQESEKNGFIKCVSFNTEDGFNPYDLPVEEIFDWAIVTGVVSARNWN